MFVIPETHEIKNIFKHLKLVVTVMTVFVRVSKLG